MNKVKYKIRDVNIERALRSLLNNPNNIDEIVDEQSKLFYYSDKFDSVVLYLDSEQTITRSLITVTIHKNDIEQIVVYDETSWNCYPLVKPPYKDKYIVRLSDGTVEVDAWICCDDIGTNMMRIEYWNSHHKWERYNGRVVEFHKIPQ